MNIEADLKEAAAARGAELIQRPNGHFQIKGKLLINYWPLSKRRTAYVAGTIEGREFVTPKQAVAMAFEPPPRVAEPDSRSKNTRNIRKRIGARMGWFCYWCRVPLTLDHSTLEHKIPLARGGLDNANNRVLACGKCNNGRGHDMPELKQVKP